jgi:redox-sensing transcriptional repressor
MQTTTPEKTIERLSLYRRILRNVQREGAYYIYSHELARRAGDMTAARVRRDLMEMGVRGDAKKGYEVHALIDQIGSFLDHPEGEHVALVGVGNLGRALLHYAKSHHPNLHIMAAFDNDTFKTGRLIHGTMCYHISELDTVLQQKNIRVAILCVAEDAAQTVADRLARAGISGILNFAPEPLEVPPDVVVENVDITMSLEKVAFLARKNQSHSSSAAQE